jgi:hypothetical protein
MSQTFILRILLPQEAIAESHDSDWPERVKSDGLKRGSKDIFSKHSEGRSRSVPKFEEVCAVFLRRA